MSTYSMQNIAGTISGPGGTVNIGVGSAPAEEGISVNRLEEKNTMTMAADGEGQHSMHASNAGKIIVRLLKTSPINAQLTLMFNFQKQSSANWGKNKIVIRDTASGDFHEGTQCAFNKNADNGYAKVGNFLEWTFDVIKLESELGTY